MSIDIDAMRKLLDSIGERVTDEDGKTAVAAANGLVIEVERLRKQLAILIDRLDLDAWEKADAELTAVVAERDKLLGDYAELLTRNDALAFGLNNATAALERLDQANTELATHSAKVKFANANLKMDVKRLTEQLQQSVAKECGALCKDLEADRDELERQRDKYRELFDQKVADRRHLIGLLRERDHKLERAQPVVDAARPLVEAIREANEDDELEWNDEPYLTLWRNLIASVGELDRCPVCGPGGCAGHTKAVAEEKRHVDPGGDDCPRCKEIYAINAAADGLSSSDTTEADR